jgi:hypothetical protein
VAGSATDPLSTRQTMVLLSPDRLANDRWRRSSAFVDSDPGKEYESW